MGIVQIGMILLVILIIIWIIVPDPIPFIDDIILVPVVAVLIGKLAGDI